MINKIFKSLAAFIHKYALPIFFVWLASLFFSVFYIFNSDYEFSETEMTGATDTEAYEVSVKLKEDFKFNQNVTAALLVDGKVPANELESLIKENFPKIITVKEIQSREIHKTQLFYIEYEANTPITVSQSMVKDIRLKLNEMEDKYNVKTYFTGHSGFFYDLKVAGKEDSSNNEKIALIMAFFILIFIFGGIISAIIPLVVAVTAVIYLNAIVSYIQIDMVPISQVLNSLLGIALAIDYSLFILSRFNEEKNIRDNTKEALQITLEKTGETILFSGLIMICSLSVLLIPELTTSRIVVKGLVLVVILSSIVSLFFLPAFLVLSKSFLDKPVFLTNFIQKIDRRSFWRKFSLHVISYPKTYFTLSIVSLLLLAYPVTKIKLWEPAQTLTPKTAESRVGYKVMMDDNWGGEVLPIHAMIKVPKGESVYSKSALTYIKKFTNELEKNNDISKVQSIVNWNEKMSVDDYHNIYQSMFSFNLLFPNQNNLLKLVNTDKGSNITMVNIYSRDVMDMTKNHEILDFCREYAINNPEYELITGGMVARARDFTVEIYSYMWEMLIIIILGIFLLMFFYMKSVVLPIKAAIMNFIPILSSFGILVLVFQYGYGQSILNTPNNGGVIALVPLVLFCIVFGLSMDYEILILSRITEFYHKTGDVKEAIVEGLSYSSTVITGAALILLGVFVPGIFSSSPLVKEISIGISAAIFIDATIVRLFLVPSFMLLMGKWNWWSPFEKK